MGGDLSLKSETDRGSCFSFEVPMEAAPVQPAKTTGPPPKIALPALRVLVAEDNAINQKVIDALLRRQGWTVTLADNGKLACEALGSQLFDLVLMDVQMPEMDGLEATRWIRQREAESASRSRIPVVALTAHASHAQHDQCMEAGMDGVVTKPVNLAALLTSIAEVLARTGVKA